MAKQTQQAVAEADVVVLSWMPVLVSAQDHEIGKYLRRLSKPCVLVANKAEGMLEGVQLSEFMNLDWATCTAFLPPMGKGSAILWTLP